MRTQASIGLGTLTFLILFVLKIIGATDMHWFWVLTSWIWMPVVVLFAGMFLVFCFGVAVVTIAAVLGR